MGRRINTFAPQATGGPSVDGFFDKIIKYIPSDIVAAWTAAIGIITGGSTTIASSDKIGIWIAFGAGVGLTAAWTWYQTNEPNQPPAVKHIIASTISFVVWAFALPIGPGSILAIGKYGSLLLIGWTLVLGIIKPDSTTKPVVNPPSPATPPTP
jgi:hypothetical protein